MKHHKKKLKAKKSNVRSEINITPLVDVVLVLLIIFMVVTPLLEKEMAVRIPELETEPQPPPDVPPDEIVVQIRNGGHLYINTGEVAKTELMAKLTTLNSTRKEKVVFFDAEDTANYGEAVSVLDIIKSSGTDIIGMMLPDPTGTTAAVGTPGAAPATPAATPQ